MESRVSKRKQNGSNKKTGLIGCSLIIIALIVIFYSLTSGNSDKTSNENLTYEDEIINKFGKDSKIAKEDNSVVIDISSTSSGNVFINIGFPRDVAEILKIVQDQKFDKVLVREITTLTDDKGNQTEGTLAAAMFDNDTIQSINFDNWVSQVTGDSTPFYELATAYYILPSAFKNSDKKIISEYSKASSDILWTKNLFE